MSHGQIESVAEEIHSAIDGAIDRIFKKWSKVSGAAVTSTSQAIVVAVYTALLESIIIREKLSGKCPSSRSLNDIVGDMGLLEQLVHEVLNIATQHLQNSDTRHVYTVNIHKRQRKLTDPK